MRTFIAFEFSESDKKFILNVQNNVKTKSLKGRFKSRDNFHLTLKFLGETDLETVEKIYDEMQLKLQNMSVVNAELNGIGKFGNGRTIRTIYIDVSDNGDIKRYAEIIDDIANKYKFMKNKNFTPHITIAQDVNLKCEFNEILKQSSFKYNVCFDKIYIIKSEQICGKRIYTPLKFIKLKQ